MFQKKKTRLKLMVVPAAIGLFLTTAPLYAGPSSSDDPFTFNMVVSAAGKACAPNASARVTIVPVGQVEIMNVMVQGLPPNTGFDFFVIQVPKSPFGVAWYQGDIQTDKNGRGHGQFVGRFSIETFAFALGSAPAPVVFNVDANLNPSFNPIQMYHLGLWFGSPQAASAAGCAATQTFFNGEHNAGVQVLNTSSFPDDQGPLRSVNPSGIMP
jgi:hypothetical protein